MIRLNVLSVFRQTEKKQSAIEADNTCTFERD